MPILDTGEETEASANTQTATTESTDQGDAPDGPRDDVSERDTVEGSTDDVNELVGSGEGLSFEEAMEQMGAEPEDTAPPSDEEAADAPGESTEADADTATESDEDASEETEADTEADTEAEEEPEAETEKASDDADDADDPDEEPEPTLVDRVNEEFDDVAVEDEEDVITELERERQGNDAIVEVAEAHPSIVDFLGEALAQVQENGQANLDVLASTHFDTDLPDPEEEPEAYKEAVDERSQTRAEREQKLQQMKQAQQDVERLAETARSSVEKVAEERDMSEDEEMAFRRELASFINNPDENFADVIYRGLNHESILEQERKKARKQGKNEAIRERREKKEGDGVAKLSSSDVETEEETEEPENEDAQDVLEAIGSGSGDPLAGITE